MKYILYARKSSESGERQIQSIDDQISKLKQVAETYKLNIVKVLTESKSAKTPNNRPKFAEMMDMIKDGAAEGILCWEINRLSRNSVDSGNIQWLLQQGVLKSIRTPNREYLPQDNVLVFSVESGMANQFILDLKRNTLRGMQSKLEKGWIPCCAPIGYVNDKENKTIVKDKERFGSVRKMWDMMLIGEYTPPKILDIVNNEWGFRTRKTKRKGGKELSRSAIYKIFTNPFYTGIIEYNNVQYSGSHEPMVTLTEYDRVQNLLGREGKPRPKKHEFAFTGLIRCEECGCLYTAQEKIKYIKNTGKTKVYTYYHCTRKKKNIKCAQTKYINEEDIEKQIEKELENYELLPEFREWALDILRRENDNESKERKKTYEKQYKTLLSTQKELDNLIKMRCRDQITDEQYNRERNQATQKITKLKSCLRETGDRAERWLELTEKTFDFVSNAGKSFKEGNLKTKKSIFRAIGQNFSIKDGKLHIIPHEWFVPIRNNYKDLENEYLRLEPGKLLDKKRRTGILEPIRLKWGG